MDAKEIEKAMDAIQGSKKTVSHYKNGNWRITWEFENCGIEINSYGDYLHVKQNEPSVWSCTPYDNVAGFKVDGSYLYVLDEIDYTYELRMSKSLFF